MAEMRRRCVVVAGDIMLDRYLIGDAGRLSPEAPVPVVAITERRAALGGAANVAANVREAGPSCRLVGATGEDPEGEELRRRLAAAGLADGHLVTVAGRPTTSKTRVIARGQQIVRLDQEVERVLDPPDLERLSTALREALGGAHALVLEDYNKGTLAPSLIRDAIGVARARNLPVVVDPKFHHFFAYAGATVFKPNRREIENALGAAVDLERPGALAEVRGRLQVDHLLVTLGPAGMVLVSGAGSVTHLPSVAREVYDVSGAGDTVTAWLGAALAAGATVLEAAYLANHAAGVGVTKAGVRTVSPEEVLERLARG